MPEIEDIVYAGRVAEKLTRVSGFVEKFSIVMLLVAIAASGVVLFNTIRISVYSRGRRNRSNDDGRSYFYLCDSPICHSGLYTRTYRGISCIVASGRYITMQR